MSLCQFRMTQNDGAARVMSGSDTDGYADKASGLPLAVVGLHVNLLAISHSEMASDKNGFVSCSALCAGALVKLRSCLKMVPAFYYAEFSRQFRLWKRERSSSYVTDDKDENGRKGRVRKKRNYF